VYEKGGAVATTDSALKSIFVGSSKEGLPFARAIKAQLSADVEVSIWNEGLFPLGSVALEELLTFSYRFDFAVLVLTPDDQIVTRNISTESPRDNVLFELGMFMSTLGSDKTFIVKTDRNLKLPSDLLGLTIAELDDERADRNLDARVGTACHTIRTAIERASHKSTLSLLPSTALAIGYYSNFVKKVCSAFSDMQTQLTLRRVGVDGKQEMRELKAHDLRGKEITFTVIIPTDFSDISHDTLKNLKWDYPNIWDVTLDTPSREFPFYTFVRTEGRNELEFFDLPTTLWTSFEAIDYCVGPTIGTDAVKDLIRQREINNFRATIHRLAREGESKRYVRTAALEYFSKGG